MLVFHFLILIVVVVILILLDSIGPKRSHLSEFELKRRSLLHDSEAEHQLNTTAAYDNILSLKRLLVALFLGIAFVLSYVLFGWLEGLLLGILIWIIYGVIARRKAVHAFASRLYEKIEEPVVNFVLLHPRLFRFLGDVALKQEATIGSREELLHVLEKTTSISSGERRLVAHALSFGDKQVQTVMIPRSSIDAVEASEFLGPLVLDDLHKTGHSRLPVIDKDLDHVVGMLHLRDLLTLHSKRSASARQVMEPHVYYIREDQTLTHALGSFLKTRHHLFIVVNEFQETVGILTLEDVMEQLLGQKIIDEFDAHEDVRAVAMRNPRANNTPLDRIDV